MKRGQVTIFIVIGILIIFLAAGLFFLKGYLQEKSSKTTQLLSTASIKFYLETCSKRAVEDSLILIGRQGGYYQTPKPYFKLYSEKTPYYFYKNKTFFPGLDDIKLQVTKCLDNKLKNCKNLSIFEKEGYSFEFSDHNISLSLGKNTNIDLNFPVKIKKGTQIAELNKFQFSFPIDYQNILTVSKTLILDYMEEPNFFCLTCFDEIEESYPKINLQIIPHQKQNLTWFLVSENRSAINNQPYMLKFVVEYHAIE